MTTDSSQEQGAPTQFNPPIRLLGGANFSTWPDLKWSRANTHCAAMQTAFTEWQASAPVSVEGRLRHDGEGVDLVARLPRGAPTHEWALTLGDAVHNLRSAFDAVAWGMANFAGATPKRPKRVMFPICDNDEQWVETLKVWVGDLEPELQARIRLMQPFSFPSEGPNMLAMLHALDVRDKHRDSLTVSTDLHAIDLNGFSFRYTDHVPTTMPRGEMYTDVPFTDGAILGTVHAGAPIEVGSAVVLRPVMQMQLTYDGVTFDALSLLQRFVAETRRYLDILMFGLASSDDAEEWADMEVTEGPMGE